MKSIKLILATIIILIYGCAMAQDKPTDKDSLRMLREFYTKYFTAMAAGPAGPLGQKKIDSLQQTYCTESLLKKLPAIIEETESDPFLKAQDYNINSLSSLTVTKSPLHASTYIVSYNDVDTNTNVVITATVLIENGRYKINSIK